MSSIVLVLLLLFSKLCGGSFEETMGHADFPNDLSTFYSKDSRRRYLLTDEVLFLSSFQDSLHAASMAATTANTWAGSSSDGAAIIELDQSLRLGQGLDANWEAYPAPTGLLSSDDSSSSSSSNSNSSNQWNRACYDWGGYIYIAADYQDHALAGTTAKDGTGGAHTKVRNTSVPFLVVTSVTPSQNLTSNCSVGLTTDQSHGTIDGSNSSSSSSSTMGSSRSSDRSRVVLRPGVLSTHGAINVSLSFRLGAAGLTSEEELGRRGAASSLATAALRSGGGGGGDSCVLRVLLAAGPNGQTVHNGSSSLLFSAELSPAGLAFSGADSAAVSSSLFPSAQAEQGQGQGQEQTFPLPYRPLELYNLTYSSVALTNTTRGSSILVEFIANSTRWTERPVSVGDGSGDVRVKAPAAACFLAELRVAAAQYPLRPTSQPSAEPSGAPSGQPSAEPTPLPTLLPSSAPTGRPTRAPLPDGVERTWRPTSEPTSHPTAQPSLTQESVWTGRFGHGVAAHVLRSEVAEAAAYTNTLHARAITAAPAGSTHAYAEGTVNSVLVTRNVCQKWAGLTQAVFRKVAQGTESLSALRISKFLPPVNSWMRGQAPGQDAGPGAFPGAAFDADTGKGALALSELPRRTVVCANETVLRVLQRYIADPDSLPEQGSGRYNFKGVILSCPDVSNYTSLGSTTLAAADGTGLVSQPAEAEAPLVQISVKQCNKQPGEPVSICADCDKQGWDVCSIGRQPCTDPSVHTQLISLTAAPCATPFGCNPGSLAGYNNAYLDALTKAQRDDLFYKLNNPDDSLTIITAAFAPDPLLIARAGITVISRGGVTLVDGTGTATNRLAAPFPAPAVEVTGTNSRSPAMLGSVRCVFSCHGSHLLVAIVLPSVFV
jgi:hypothetical protein